MHIKDKFLIKMKYVMSIHSESQHFHIIALE